MASYKNEYEGRKIGRFTVFKVPDVQPTDAVRWVVNDVNGTLYQGRTLNECLEWAKQKIEDELEGQSM